MSIPAPFRHLIDDAAIFPPGLAPLDEAVSTHRAYRQSALATLVGPFVVDTPRLPDLLLLPGLPSGFEVSVVAAAWEEIPDVVARVASSPARLAGLEVKLGGAGTASEQVRAIARVAPAGVPTYVEAPRPLEPAWSGVLDAVVPSGLRLKFRTGGTVSAAFPSESELARWIVAAATAGVPFKATAGLHHAVRRTAPDTGFEHHGYLNLLVGAARAVAGEPVEPVLAERDAAALARAFDYLGDDAAAGARRLFVSYGSCSVLEPFDDLTALGLIPSQHEQEPA